MTGQCFALEIPQLVNTLILYTCYYISLLGELHSKSGSKANSISMEIYPTIWHWANKCLMQVWWDWHVFDLGDVWTECLCWLTLWCVEQSLTILYKCGIFMWKMCFHVQLIFRMSHRKYYNLQQIEICLQYQKTRV